VELIRIILKFAKVQLLIYQQNTQKINFTQNQDICNIAVITPKSVLDICLKGSHRTTLRQEDRRNADMI